MRKLHIAPYCIALTVGNCFVPLLLGLVAHIMGKFYHGLPEGGESILAGCTRLALRLPSWFYIFTALSALACVGLCIRRVSVALLVHWLLAVSILESIGLSFFAVGICLSLGDVVGEFGN